MCNAADISIITITKNNDAGLLKTFDSIKQLVALSENNFKIEWILKNGIKEASGVIKKIINDAAELDILVYDDSKDAGIYDAMWQAFEKSTGLSICYMNAGDKLLPDSFAKMLHEFMLARGRAASPMVMYGESLWDSNIFLVAKYFNKLSPSLGRMPSHQAMIIDRELQKQFKFDSQLALYADLDFKIRLYNSGVSFERFPLPVCVAEAGGVSQNFSTMKALKSRTNETYYLMRKNYNFLWGIIYSSVFFVWNLRKLIANKISHNFTKF
jgi:glycosyltransferase involved in cell wall biosynthesis